MGNISLEDDKPPRIIVSGVKELIENSEYERVAQKREEESKTETPLPKEKTETIPENATKVFLKLPDMSGEVYKKALNLVSIFEGQLSVILYDSSTKKYISTNLGIEATPYVISQLRELIGDENVVVR